LLIHAFPRAAFESKRNVSDLDPIPPRTQEVKATAFCFINKFAKRVVSND